MNKILSILSVFVLTLFLSSCGTQFKIVYGVNIAGEGDGNFKVTFPQGSYAMDGKASLELLVGDTLKFNDTEIRTKAQVLSENKSRELKALKSINDSIDNQFNAFIGDGTYDLWLHGFVKEEVTGLVVEVNKHLTNKSSSLKSTREIDKFPYIK